MILVQFVGGSYRDPMQCWLSRFHFSRARIGPQAPRDNAHHSHNRSTFPLQQHFESQFLCQESGHVKNCWKQRSDLSVQFYQEFTLSQIVDRRRQFKHKVAGDPVRGRLELRLVYLCALQTSTIRTSFRSKANLEFPSATLTFVAASSDNPGWSQRRCVGQSKGPERQIPLPDNRL